MTDRFQKKLLLALVFTFLFFASNTVFPATKKTKDDLKITSLELQKKIMGFADSYVSLVYHARTDYREIASSEENYKLLNKHLIFSESNAFIIAADPIPNHALLDMVVMISLGHSIFKEYWIEKIGSEVMPIVEKMALAEKGIWKIANLVISEKQQIELRRMIRDWRDAYPSITAFSFIRFQAFSSDLEKIDIAKKKKEKKLFCFHQ